LEDRHDHHYDTDALKGYALTTVDFEVPLDLIDA
jgi:hypothetical protein